MAVTDRALTGKPPVPGQRKGDPVGGADEDAPAKGGKKKKIIGAVVLLVALLAAGAGAYFMFMGGGGEEAAAEEAAAEVEYEPGLVVPLEPITINLADGRYLQVGIALQEAVAEGGGEHAETDGSQALDILIHKLSGKPMAELASVEQRDAVKAELVEEIKHAYHDHVYDIYFTSFVMQ
ncbi:flagellar basal body-associated FliL family protein [Aquipuribacter hungaricus]|uniref:Flagellar protein FliL n=1 Tax=Aquipuribacter hungaricus TaxID=545624 RepID=A0ABV7WLQ5_9MICO